jgi:hypothetical protein
MNKEEIKIEPIENGFKASVEIPKKVIDLELNEYLNKVDEINRLIINDKNELYIRELLNRIDKAIGCIETFLCTEEYINLDGEAIANNYQEVLEKLKGVDK